MSFLSIVALAVALLVAAPIAAHLLRRRHAEEIRFPPASLVPPTPPAARRRSMLEDRGLFAIRALSILALAVLGATPFVHCSRLALTRKDGASVALAIVVDDSLSMRAPLDGGPARAGAVSRFDRALDAAKELVAGLNNGDAVAVVLAGAPARISLASTTNMAAARGALDLLSPSDRATDLDGAIDLARELLKGLAQTDKRIVLLSDLADGSPASAPLATEGTITLWSPLPELTAHGEGDCAIIRADRSGTKIRTRIVCTPTTSPDRPKAVASANLPVAEGAPQGSASAAPAPAPALPSASSGRSLRIMAGEKVLAETNLGPSIRAEEISLEVPADAPTSLRAALTPGDVIDTDDEAPVITEGGKLPIAVVVDATTSHVETGGPPPIEQALSAMELDVDVRPLPAVPEHPDELNSFSGLIVDDAPGFTPEVRRSLGAWVERGGVVFLSLGPRAAAAPLGAGFDPLVPGVLRWGASPVKGIDPASAPTLGAAVEGYADIGPRGRISLEPQATEEADMLARWSDAAPFAFRRSLGRGAILALTVPFSAEESDLVLRPAFLSLLDRFIAMARTRGGARRIEVGEAWTFDGFDKIKVQRLGLREGERPKSVPVLEQDERRRAVADLAGAYELDLDGELALRVASVPEREIDLRPRKADERARAETLGGVTPSLDASPHVALLLLGLLAVEMLLRTAGQRRQNAEARQ